MEYNLIPYMFILDLLIAVGHDRRGKERLNSETIEMYYQTSAFRRARTGKMNKMLMTTTAHGTPKPDNTEPIIILGRLVICYMICMC